MELIGEIRPDHSGLTLYESEVPCEVLQESLQSPAFSIDQDHYAPIAYQSQKNEMAGAKANHDPGLNPYLGIKHLLQWYCYIEKNPRNIL